MSDGSSEEEAEEGAPMWMATFADLMSLLLCFFVLLLSFSEMDVLRYKQVAGSLKQSFGVQSKVEAQMIPRGVSAIATEFSPGKPTPTPLPIINQDTTNDSSTQLKVGTPNSNDPDYENTRMQESEREFTSRLSELLTTTDSDVDLLRTLLKDGIRDGQIDVINNFNEITIRIRERGTFPSGSAILHPEFVPIIQKLKFALVELDGTISVEGHTDNVPINSELFPSNWELSAGRALAVAQQLMSGNVLAQERFMVVGHSSTRPISENDSVTGRAANRRVEIVIRGELMEFDEESLLDGDIEGIETDLSGVDGESQPESDVAGIPTDLSGIAEDSAAADISSETDLDQNSPPDL